MYKNIILALDLCMGIWYDLGTLKKGLIDMKEEEYNFLQIGSWWQEK